MSADLLPVRLCCGSRHAGATCPDGRVMCCLCFERVTTEDLSTTPDGEKVDVCLPCAERERDEAARRSLSSVIEDITAEHQRNLSRWGTQSHPNGTGLLHSTLDAEIERKLCEAAADAGTLTWRHILFEEVFEAAAERDPARLREELVQVAAVVVAWIESIDRKSREH